MKKYLIGEDTYIVNEFICSCFHADRLVSVNVFSQLDTLILHELMRNYPDYAPMDSLFYIATGHDVHDKTISSATYGYQHVNRSVRNIRSSLNVNVKSIREIGYVMEVEKMLSPVTKLNRFVKFELEGIIPADQTLAYNINERVLTLFSCSDILEQQIFTPLENGPLIAVLSVYPRMCSHATVLYESNQSNDLEYWRREVEFAFANDCVDELMRPTRNIMSRMRLRMRHFGIEIAAANKIGYVVVPIMAKIREGLR